MPTLTLPQKLQMKPNTKALVLNAPEGWSMPVLPDGVNVFTSASEPAYDFVLLFCTHQADIDTHALKAISHVKPEGGLWFAYPKAGKLNTNINRDRGWAAVTQAGWDGVRQVSIDDTWSALRFRPVEAINYTPSSTRNPKNKS
jgi:hypothetical protein